ncbi:MAG: shikimate dehydrogenase [Hyphomicrobiaceae bacterium]|nr:shikimate dehydrogenase [Hyphomicrobiaceae bacterium]
MTADPRAFVIGWPIKHSRSPLIHGYWLEAYGLVGSYEKIAVKPDDLAAFLAGLGAAGYVGGNVTVPHKEDAFRLAAVTDDAARAIGAANTLWLDGGRLHASNTDAYGFMTHLGETASGWAARDRPVLVLGAGGAARAIVYGFLAAGVEMVMVCNRTLARAEELAAHFGPKVVARPWQDRVACAERAGVLVNTTTLGMSGADPLDMPLTTLPADAVVADIVYVPLLTPLLARAKRRGLAAVDGLGMLLHQAVPGFERWFGVRPTVTPALRERIVADIEGR